MRLKNIFYLTTIILTITLHHPAIALCEPVNHKLTGDSYLRKKLFDPAIVEYKQAIAANPVSTDTYFNLAIAYYSMGNIKEASSTLEKLIALNPQDTEALYNLACLKLYQQDFETANLCLEKAKIYCNCDSQLTSLIDSSLAFMETFKTLEPKVQQALCLLLMQALPSTGTVN